MRALALVLLLAGCLPTQASTYGVSFGSLAASPVVVTRMSVNDGDFNVVPVLVDAWSDEVMPRSNGVYSMQYAGGDDLALDIAWVELLTGRAYSASISVPVEELEQEGDSLYFAPVFGPNGLLVVTSDPVPTSAENQPTRDVAQVCATRMPEGDTDYRAAPDSLPDLAAILADQRPPAGDAACPAPEE